MSDKPFNIGPFFAIVHTDANNDYETTTMELNGQTLDEAVENFRKKLDEDDYGTYVTSAVIIQPYEWQIFDMKAYKNEQFRINKLKEEAKKEAEDFLLYKQLRERFGLKD